MSDNTNTTKKRPDYIAYFPRQRAGQSPQFVRIGVGFIYKNGSIGVLSDALPLSGQILLIGADAEKPSVVSYGTPTRKPDFQASMVRDGSGDQSFWTSIGNAYRQEGYISVLLDMLPTNGKLVLSIPKENV